MGNIDNPYAFKDVSPSFVRDGEGTYVASPAPASDSSAASPAATPVSTDSIPGPMRFSELNMQDNPIYKVLNDITEGDPIQQPSTAQPGQVTSPIQQGTDPKPAVSTSNDPAAQPGQPAPMDINSVLEQIKVLNPKAAEKYNNPEAVAKTLLSQEKTLTQTFQDKAQLTKTVENLNAELEKLKAAQAQPPAQQADPVQKPLTDEEIAKENETLLAEIMENPREFVRKLSEQVQNKAIEIARQEFKPVADIVQKEQNYKTADEAINTFKGATDELGNLLHPEFEAYAGPMSKVLAQFPELKADPKRIPEAMELAYNVVKGMNSQGPIDVGKLLNDPEVLNKHVYGNEAIKNKFVTDYVKNIRDGAPPVVIASQPGGAPPASPPAMPTNIKDAGKAAQKFFGW